MRALAPIAAALILAASACSARDANGQGRSAGDPGTPHSPSAAEARRKLGLTDAQCGAAAGYLNGLEDAGLFRPDGTHVKRQDWAALAPDVRSSVIWDLAKFATCYDGQALHSVTIRDEDDAVIVTQPVSIDPSCHGDVAASTPGATWYRC